MASYQVRCPNCGGYKTYKYGKVRYRDSSPVTKGQKTVTYIILALLGQFAVALLVSFSSNQFVFATYSLVVLMVGMIVLWVVGNANPSLNRPVTVKQRYACSICGYKFEE